MIHTLFNENITVDCIGTNGQTSSKSHIILNLKIDERQNRAEKEFIFCISRDDDPLFIFTLSLRRSEYELLKRDQELDVEFDAFPKKIIDFVTCLDSSCGSHLRGGIYDDNTLFRFDLVGKMGFKWVTILSLPLQRVTEKALVTYLAEKIMKYKEYLKELDTLRDSLSLEQAENKRLRNSLTAKEKVHSDSLQKWEEERNEVIIQSKHDLEEINEELNADKELMPQLNWDGLRGFQMLTQEVSTLKEEINDFRYRIDDLIEQNNQLEDRIHVLTEELGASENQLHDLGQKKEELQQELNERDEETHSRIVHIRELEDKVNDADRENKKLREKLQFVKEGRDQWKSEHDKAVEIIKKLYNERGRRVAMSDQRVLKEEVKEMEKDLEERKRTIDALTDSNRQLRAKLENLSVECEKAKTDAEMWKIKCEKKELLISDLIQCRRSSPIISSPLQQQSNLTYGNTTPTVYPRVLGVTNWTAQITTPLRNTGVLAKIPDHQKENELNLMAVTPPTMTNLNKVEKS